MTVHEQDFVEKKKLLKRGAATNVNRHCLEYSLVGGYLAAIVTANWVVSTFGPAASVVTAFIFIGLNITTRDYLHDIWRSSLKRNMFLLIAAGSLVSVVFNVGQIAMASFIAFAASETVDALVYHRLGKYPRWLRINGSNVPSAAVDSLLFPALAFGWPLLWFVVFGQFIAKIGGGFLWSVLLVKIQILDWIDNGKTKE